MQVEIDNYDYSTVCRKAESDILSCLSFVLTYSRLKRPTTWAVIRHAVAMARSTNPGGSLGAADAGHGFVLPEAGGNAMGPRCRAGRARPARRLDLPVQDPLG